jgi:hypothetical protein
LYLGSGVLGGWAVVLFSDAPHGATVGASASICGLLTSFAAWAWLHRQYLPPELVQAHFRIVGQNLLLLVLIGMMPNVSNLGHAGGAVAGVILSIPLAWMNPSAPRSWRLLGAAAFAVVFLAAGAAITFVVAPRYSQQRAFNSVATAEPNLIEAFMKDAKPLLDDEAQPDLIPPERDRLKRRFAAAAAECRQLAQTLATEIPDLDPQSARAWSHSKDLLEKRGEFFDQMIDVVDHPGNWPAQRRADLERTFQ